MSKDAPNEKTSNVISRQFPLFSSHLISCISLRTVIQQEIPSQCQHCPEQDRSLDFNRGTLDDVRATLYYASSPHLHYSLQHPGPSTLQSKKRSGRLSAGPSPATGTSTPRGQASRLRPTHPNSDNTLNTLTRSKMKIAHTSRCLHLSPRPAQAVYLPRNSTSH